MRKLLAILAMVWVSGLAWADTNWAAYHQVGNINDYGRVLGPKETTGLNVLLNELSAQYNVQLALLTLPSAGQENLAKVAKEFYNQWDMGRNTVNKSALLVVSADDGAMHLHVGMGLRGVLTRKWTNELGQQLEPLAQHKDLNKACIAGITTLVRRVYDNASALPKPGSQIVSSASPLAKTLTSGIGGVPVAGLLAVGFGGLLIFSTVLRAGKQTSAYEWGNGFERERTGPFGNKRPFGNENKPAKRFI